MKYVLLLIFMVWLILRWKMVSQQQKIINNLIVQKDI